MVYFDDVTDHNYAEHYKMGEINVTLDYLYKMAKQNVFAMLASQGDETTGKNLFDIYREAEISPFLSMIARLLLSEHNGIVYGDDNIGEIMAAFRALSANGKLTFYKSISFFLTISTINGAKGNKQKKVGSEVAIGGKNALEIIL